MLSSGFAGANISQVLLFGVIASSILVSITDSKYLFYIQVVPHLWRYKQAWRLLIWQVGSLPWAQLLGNGLWELMSQSDLLHELYRAPICGHDHIPYAYC